MKSSWLCFWWIYNEVQHHGVGWRKEVSLPGAVSVTIFLKFVPCISCIKSSSGSSGRRGGSHSPATCVTGCLNHTISNTLQTLVISNYLVGYSLPVFFYLQVVYWLMWEAACILWVYCGWLLDPPQVARLGLDSVYGWVISCTLLNKTDLLFVIYISLISSPLADF